MSPRGCAAYTRTLLIHGPRILGNFNHILNIFGGYQEYKTGLCLLANIFSLMGFQIMRLFRATQVTAAVQVILQCQLELPVPCICTHVSNVKFPWFGKIPAELDNLLIPSSKECAINTQGWRPLDRL